MILIYWNHSVVCLHRMVCHETYKDPDNWISPDEIENIDGKKHLKKDKSKLISVGPQVHVQIKKIQSIQKISLPIMELTRKAILSDSPRKRCSVV